MLIDLSTSPVLKMGKPWPMNAAGTNTGRSGTELTLKAMTEGGWLRIPAM
jgi:hypothetical protein